MNGNVRPDMLRQGIAQPPMLGVNAPFMQNMPQSGQQQLSPNHLGLPPNSNPSNPGMMLNNSAGTMNQAAHQQRYHLMQQGGQPRQMQIRQGQGGQPMMVPSGGPMPGNGGQPHMSALSHGQGMSFNPMMSQPPGNGQVRRVSSQPQMNQNSGPLSGMSPGVVNASLSLGMNPPGNMPPMRQIPTHLQNLRMQNQHMQNQMSPDMPMTMNRQGPNPGMVPGRTGSAQLMNSLSQPPSLQHPAGHPQNQFPNAVQIPSQHQQPQISSPRLGSHPQAHTPNMSMNAPGPSHTPVTRPQMNSDDGSMAFMNFQNPQFAQGHNTTRMPSTNGQFAPFPSSTPPIQMSDMSQPGSATMGTPGSTPSRTGFHLTPAQQFEQMNADGYPGHFMPPPSLVPPRPPSHNNSHSPLSQQHQSHQTHRQSPHPTDPHINAHPQRPLSQPQTIPRPSSQQAHTPRTSHPQLPPGPPQPPPGGRMPLPHHGPPQGPQIPMPGPGQHMIIAPRPPQQLPPAAVPSNVVPTAQAPSDTPPSAAASIPRPLNNLPAPIGNGQGLIRLLQFSGILANENKTQKLQLSWWSELIKEYFTPKAVMKFTLWKDNQRNEAKPFEIGVPILPRFFLVTTQSGVKSMTLSLDGARERMYAPGHSIVECVGAIWTYKYNNGYTVTLRGPLTVHVVITAVIPPPNSQTPQGPPNYLLKFEDFQFDANFHDKYIALDSVMGNRVMGSPKTPKVRNASTPTPGGGMTQQQQLEEDKKWEEPRVTIERASIPGEPVNAFGIPQATMRCLELAESVGQMADLISFSNDSALGPLEALKKFASKLREMQVYNPPPPNNLMNGAMPNNAPPNPFAPMHSGAGNVPPTPAVTLYSSAPPSVTNPPPTPTNNSPKNASSSASNSPQKQHKTIPQPQAGSSSATAPAASPAMSSGATNTPALANASLKRKQGPDAASPTTAPSDQPPLKRAARKRRPTGAGGGANP